MIGPATAHRPKIRKMPQRYYPPTYYLAEAECCVRALQAALGHAQAAGAPYTLARVKLALSSARGAVRNAEYRVTRAKRGGGS